MSRWSRTQRAARGSHLPSRDRWLISYADFVTLLLAVFIVLFATAWRTRQTIQTVAAEVQSGFNALSVIPIRQANSSGEPILGSQQRPGTGEPMPPQAVDLAKLGVQLRGVLGDAISKQQIVVQQTQDGFVISLRELGFFDSGTATLLPGAVGTLRRTAEVLQQYGLDVRVEGHSDDQPIHTAAYHSNWELSTARAMTVLSLLLEQTSFPPTKISVAGYGPYHPVADNATPEGRRANRRVDLVILAPKTNERQLQ